MTQLINRYFPLSMQTGLSPVSFLAHLVDHFRFFCKIHNIENGEKKFTGTCTPKYAASKESFLFIFQSEIFNFVSLSLPYFDFGSNNDRA